MPLAPVDSWAVGNVEISSVTESGTKLTRVVVNLKRDASYIVVPKGDHLVVTVTPREVAPESYFARKTAGERRKEIEQMQSAAQRQAVAAGAKAAEAEARAKAAEAKAAAASKAAHADRKAAADEAARARSIADKARVKAESLLTTAERDAAARSKAADAQARAVTDEAKVKAASLLTQAEQAKKAAESGRAQAEAMLAQAEAAKKAAQEERDQAKAAAVEAQRALSDAKKAASSASASKRKKSELDRAVAQAEEAAKAAKERKTAAESQLGKIERDRVALTKVLREQEARSKSLDAEIDSKAGELARLEKSVQEARKQYESLGGAASQKAVDEAKAEASKAQARHAALAKEVERLRGDLAQATQRAGDAEAELAGKRGARLEKARRESVEADKALAEARRSYQVRKRALEKLGDEVATRSEELDRLEQQRRMLASQGDALRKKNAEAKKQLETKSGELEKVESSLASNTRRLEEVQAELAEAEARLDKSMRAGEARMGDEWKSQRKAAGNSRVKDVRFEDTPTESRVIVDIDGPLVYDGGSLTPTMQLLRLEGATIPQSLERSLDTSSFDAPVGMITSFREGDDVKIVVAMQGASDPVLEEKPGQLIWKFPRSKRGPKSEVVSMGSRVSGFVTPPAPMARTSGSRGKWRGERIDIELQDAPIKDVLLLFSDIGRVNIIAGRQVQGTVTMKLNSVPWDQALDIILRSLGLGMVQEGNVIRVATAEDLEQERAKAIEEANARVQLKPLETRLIPLSYATVDDMLPKVQTVLSPRGTVTPDSRTNMLIIMDVAENIALAQQLLTQLDSQTPQVLIEARIVEARTNWLRQLGIQWGFDYIASPGTGNPTGIAFPNSVGVAGGSGGQNTDTRGLILPAAAANPNYAVDLPAPVGPGNGGALGFSFGSISGNLNTNLRLSAAEDTGEVRIISAPKIVTLDNTQAQIEQGVQIPISQVSAAGVNTRYVNATLALRVTPHVTNEGAVLLDVQVQKNEADFINTGARGDPTILTRQATSQMLITDGDTAVIGGIYTRNQSVNRKKVPWLADIPILGWFFKNKSEADTRSEVLIFLTPKIINRSTSIGG